MGKTLCRISGIAICSIFFLGPLFAQGTYTAEYKASLTGAASVVTLQLSNATTARSANLIQAALYCSVECEITLERNGTPATTTAISAVPTRTGMSTASAVPYRSSNVGTGTVMARYVVPAGATFVLDLENVIILPMSTAENFSIRTASITGTCITVLKWREE